jgi:hypothetical protein
MPGQRNQRRYQRYDPSSGWMVRGSDPAAGTSPDRYSARPRRTVRRRRRGPVHALLMLPFLPFRLVLSGYVRALLRAVLPWLLPLVLLAALPRIVSMLAGH